MNVMKAMQSNKKFKRRAWEAWYTTEDIRNGELLLNPPDILADDWEVEEIEKEPQKVLNAELLYEAFISFYNDLRRN